MIGETTFFGGSGNERQCEPSLQKKFNQIGAIRAIRGFKIHWWAAWFKWNQL